MSCPLPTDCLNEIFENLDDDKITLHSCLLVSRLYNPDGIPFIPFISFSGARNCLTDLSELQCNTFIDSKFFYGLSQIYHNLQSLAIDFENEVSNGLKELVSSQNNLKNLKLSSVFHDWADIVPALIKHTNTLTKLQLQCDCNLSLSFVSSLLNLQEIEFSFYGLIPFENFRELQYATFPKLQVLKIPNQIVKTKYLTKFLEINGKNLQKCYLDHNVSD